MASTAAIPASIVVWPRDSTTIVVSLSAPETRGSGVKPAISRVRIVPEAPTVRQAVARQHQAERDLAQAELNLRYCEIVSEIDGVVTRRNVNPGNNVQVGQSLMAVRSITEIWIDANFKETQLKRMHPNQRATIHVDRARVLVRDALRAKE